MKQIVRLSMAVILIGIVTGCYSAEIDWKRHVDEDIARFLRDGWIYSETLGTPGQWVSVFHFESDSASEVEAGWTEKGVEQRKAYTQERELYYIQGYMKANGDSFVVIFKRPVEIQKKAGRK